jgi:hypothetical protein
MREDWWRDQAQQLHWQNLSYTERMEFLDQQLGSCQQEHSVEVRSLKMKLQRANLDLETARRDQQAAWNSVQMISDVYRGLLGDFGCDGADAVAVQNALTRVIGENQKKEAEIYQLKYMVERLKKFRSLEMEEGEEYYLIYAPPNTPLGKVKSAQEFEECKI